MSSMEIIRRTISAAVHPSSGLMRIANSSSWCSGEGQRKIFGQRIKSLKGVCCWGIKSEATQFRASASSMAVSSYYKRLLPSPPAIEFSSVEGRQVFDEAFHEGTMEGFFKLIEQFSTQVEPAFCGLTSLAIVLNALSIDPGRPWKGPWRWFNEELLDCCKSLDKVKEEGIAFGQVGCLAKCNGAAVQNHRHGRFTCEEFRNSILKASKSCEEHVVVAYSRKTFSQTGDGHYSPIGGYHQSKDLVLILDTARFKYPPHWVPLTLLYEAMGPLDPSTQLPRGYLVLKASKKIESLCFTLDRSSADVPDSHEMCHFVLQTTKALAQRSTSAKDLISNVARMALDKKFTSFISCRPKCCCQNEGRQGALEDQEEIVEEIRKLKLYRIVMDLTKENRKECQLPERLIMFLLLIADSVDESVPSEFKKDWDELLDASRLPPVARELDWLRNQFSNVKAIDDMDQEKPHKCCSN